MATGIDAAVGQFLHQHGFLLPFTQQGLEKYSLTKMFVRSTNMRRVIGL